ncbi:hypothetical protein GYMLUDRAFT_54326 [Collybiopsis luxurians FD-317 M1]|nr:hypothetical protein GYMLUDRAFT_54326 [Collybiopsis luxurians FD-317 M1]
MDYCLPTDFSPTHHDLTLLTDLALHKFCGTVKNDLKVNKDTSNIVLNAADLQLADVSVTIAGAGSSSSEASAGTFVPVSQSIDAINQRAMFVFPTTFTAGSRLRLFIAFQGQLSGNLIGYYEGTWEHEGEKKLYTVTQFEPTAARRAFPCWDEPLCKSTFGMSMVSKSSTVNLFNAPVVSEEPYEEADDVHGLLKGASSSEDWKVTRFDLSPLMSAYLVAFANGEFEYVESAFTSPISGKTRPLRVHASPPSVHQAKYLLEVTAKVLPVYEQVFDIEYPLPKLDTLVIQDMDAYAMENWGLITGRASHYLLDPNASNVAQKQAIVGMQFHEIAHMWFGNITTMEWWTYLYLNEGFATLMGELIIPDRVFPEWKLDSAFITLHVNEAMALDNKLSSHPVEVDCPDANKINQVTFTDSPQRSPSTELLSRSLTLYHTPRQLLFLACWRIMSGSTLSLRAFPLYLKAHLYGNSIARDLWKGFDASEFMNAYITKPGIPLVTVAESEDGIRVAQCRFLQSADVDDAKTLWRVLSRPFLYFAPYLCSDVDFSFRNVPLNILTVDSDGKRTVDKFVLKSQSDSYSIHTKWPFKLNARAFGYCELCASCLILDLFDTFPAADRVLYTPARFRSIAIEAAKSDSVIDARDRLGLVQDAFALARAHFLGLSTALDLLTVFKDLREYYVWASVSTALESLTSIWWENQPVVELLNELRRFLFKPIVSELGYEYSADEHPDVSLLRTCAITNASQANDDELTRAHSVVNELRIRFKPFQETKDSSLIPEELQRPIYSTAVEHGGEEEYEFVKGIVENPQTPTQQLAAIAAMCSTENRDRILSTFDYTKTKARDQDVHHFITELMKNRKIYEKFKDGFSIGNLIKLTFRPLTTKNDYEETKTFFDGTDTSNYALIVPQVLESIQENRIYIEKSTDDLLNWLDNWKKGQ